MPCASALSAMKPASAATWAASAATAINAGSATVVPKPKQNANANKAVALPLRANASAMASPKGKRPLSSPWMKNARPATTHTRPTTSSPRSGNGWRSTTTWKKAMTATMGARSRSASRIRPAKAATGRKKPAAPANMARRAFTSLATVAPKGAIVPAIGGETARRATILHQCEGHHPLLRVFARGGRFTPRRSAASGRARGPVPAARTRAPSPRRAAPPGWHLPRSSRCRSGRGP